MSAVWVVTPPNTTLQWPVRYFADESVARAVHQAHSEFGITSTLSRETLLTPEHAAVIDAALAYIASFVGAGFDTDDAHDALMAATKALRARGES